MESIPSNSLIGNSYNNYFDYSYRNGESLSKPLNEKEMEVNQGIKFKEVKFEKKSNDKMIVYVLTQDKKKFKSNEITFSKFKKRNDIKYEDIDTFIREINNINKNKNKIENEFSIYFEDIDIIRIKYRYLKKNNNNVEIVFIVRDEKNIKNNNNINQINFIKNNENNNILNNLKEEINKLSNLYLNLEENYNKREKILKLNSYINTLENSKQKIPSILYKKPSTISTVSKILNQVQTKIDLDLLFSLQRDGDNIEKFHKLVNNIKPTLLFFELYNRKYYFYYINESWENENINNDYQIKTNDKMFLYCFNDKKKLLENKQLAIYCCNNYGPMIGEYYKNDVDFINNLDFDCSLSLEKVFTSKKDIFTTANNYNQFYLKELEIYKLNIYN